MIATGKFSLKRQGTAIYVVELTIMKATSTNIQWLYEPVKHFGLNYKAIESMIMELTKKLDLQSYNISLDNIAWGSGEYDERIMYEACENALEIAKSKIKQSNQQ